MSSLMDDLKNRLRMAMNYAGVRAIELSEKTGIPKSSISQYMSGYTKPNNERIYLISKTLNVSEAWLMGFDVPMERIGNEPHTDSFIKLTPNEQRLLTSYKKLNTIGQCKADAYIDGLLENEAYCKNNNSEEITYTTRTAAFGGASKKSNLTKNDIKQLVDELENMND